MIKLNLRKKLNLHNGETELRIDTEIESGSITALYGPSGAGKTSVLKMLAGLLQPDEGIIEVDGATWFNSYKKINLLPQKRDIGFVFQDYALFPNMTVLQNLEFAKADHTVADEIPRLLNMMQLEQLAHQKPALLSGGQQQRVALARAIIRRPAVLLLDEPLSAVDHELRIDLRNQIASLHQQYNFTTLLVSHEVSDIYYLTERILHLERGSVVADTKPKQWFNPSGDLLLIGEITVLSESKVEVLANNQVIVLPITAIELPDPAVGQKVTLRCTAMGMYIQKLS